MNKEEIRSYIKEHGVAGFQAGWAALIEGKKLANGQTIKLNPRRLSFQQMWEGTVGSISETFDNPAWHMEAGALDATGFPSASERLLATVAIEGYANQTGVADMLVPTSYEPKTLTERIVGFTMPEGPKIVLPGEPYPTIGFGEKYVTFEQAIHNKKEGFEIQVTEEAIRLDQTNMILDRAMGAGMTLQTERERRTVRAVLGIGLDTGTVQDNVYFPSGTDTALYLAGSNNLRTNGSPIYNHPGKTADSVLGDYTDLQEVLTVHAQNITDDRQLGGGRPIVWTPDTMLIPVSLATTAGNILQSVGVTYMQNIGTSTAPEIRHNSPNPLINAFRGALPMPIASAYVDEVSATVWVLYDKTRTFVRINIFPFQTFRAPMGYGWNRDVPFSLRVREWSRVVARDFRTTIRSNGA